MACKALLKAYASEDGNARASQEWNDMTKTEHLSVTAKTDCPGGGCQIILPLGAH